MTQDLKLSPYKLKEIFTKITSKLVHRDESEKTGLIDNLYDAVVSVTSEITTAQAGSLYLEQLGKGDKPATINMVAGTGYEKTLIKKSTYFRGEGVTGWIWEHGEARKFDSYEELKKSGIWQGKYDKEKRKNEKSEGRNWAFWSNIMVPLKIGDHIIGVLKVENKLDNGNKVAFTEEEFHILEVIAGTIALAIEDRRIYEKAHARIIETIQTISSILASREVITSRRFYRLITRTCVSIFNAKACSLFIKQPNVTGEEVIDMEAGEGYEENLILKSAYGKGEGLTGWIWQTGEKVKCDSYKELTNHPFWRGKYDGEKKRLTEDWKCWSFIGVPLTVGTEVIGVLKVENKVPEPNHFTDDDFRILDILARMIALAIEIRNYQLAIFEMGLRATRLAHDTQGYILNIKMPINNAIRMTQQERDKGKIIQTLNDAVASLKEFEESLGRIHENEKKERVELAKILDLLKERIGRSIKEKEIQFDVILSPSVSGYLIYLEVVIESVMDAFRNLIVNSMEEFERLEGDLEFQPKLLIKVEKDESKNWIDIYIVDNGKGLTESQHLEFKDKKRLPTIKKGGKGLGLEYVYGLIRENGGDFEHILPSIREEITFSNEKIKIVCTRNSGCIFKISLPFIEARKYLVKDKYNFLVIDDDEERIKNIKKTIENLNPSQFSRFSFEFMTSPQILITQEELIDKYDFVLLDFRFDKIPNYHKTGGDIFDSIMEEKRKRKIKLYTVYTKDSLVPKYNPLEANKIFASPDEFESFLKGLIQCQAEL